MEPMSRAERRAATAARILAAAQAEFGERGIDGGTVRGIAARAGVDPSLVLQHYGTKERLFALAVRPVAERGAAGSAAHLAEVLDLRLRALPPDVRALMRSMLTSEEAAGVLRTALQQRADALAEADGGEDAELRAALAVASILGVTVAKHFLRLQGLEDVDPARVERVARTWFAALVETGPSAPRSDGVRE